MALSLVQATVTPRHNDTASNTYTGDRPSGWAENQVGVAHVLARAAEVTMSGVPTGWELAVRVSQAGVANTLFVYLKKLTASEPATYDWTGSASVVSTVSIGSASEAYLGATALDSLSGTPVGFYDSDNSTNTVHIPAMTTAHADALLFAIGQNGGAQTITSWSDSITERWDGNSSGGQARTIYGGTLPVATAGTVGPFTAEKTAASVALTATFALRPQLVDAQRPASPTGLTVTGRYA